MRRAVVIADQQAREIHELEKLKKRAGASAKIAAVRTSNRGNNFLAHWCILWHTNQQNMSLVGLLKNSTNHLYIVTSRIISNRQIRSDIWTYQNKGTSAPIRKDHFHALLHPPCKIGSGRKRGQQNL